MLIQLYLKYLMKTVNTFFVSFTLTSGLIAFLFFFFYEGTTKYFKILLENV